MTSVKSFTGKEDVLSRACVKEFSSLNMQRDAKVGELLGEAIKVRTDSQSALMLDVREGAMREGCIDSVRDEAMREGGIDSVREEAMREGCIEGVREGAMREGCTSPTGTEGCITDF